MGLRRPQHFSNFPRNFCRHPILSGSHDFIIKGGMSLKEIKYDIIFGPIKCLYGIAPLWLNTCPKKARPINLICKTISFYCVLAASQALLRNKSAHQEMWCWKSRFSSVLFLRSIQLIRS